MNTTRTTLSFCALCILLSGCVSSPMLPADRLKTGDFVVTASIEEPGVFLLPSVSGQVTAGLGSMDASLSLGTTLLVFYHIGLSGRLYLTESWSFLLQAKHTGATPTNTTEGSVPFPTGAGSGLPDVQTTTGYTVLTSQFKSMPKPGETFYGGPSVSAVLIHGTDRIAPSGIYAGLLVGGRAYIGSSMSIQGEFTLNPFGYVFGQPSGPFAYPFLFLPNLATLYGVAQVNVGLLFGTRNPKKPAKISPSFEDIEPTQPRPPIKTSDEDEGEPDLEHNNIPSPFEEGDKPEEPKEPKEPEEPESPEQPENPKSPQDPEEPEEPPEPPEPTSSK